MHGKVYYISEAFATIFIFFPFLSFHLWLIIQKKAQQQVFRSIFLCSALLVCILYCTPIHLFSDSPNRISLLHTRFLRESIFMFFRYPVKAVKHLLMFSFFLIYPFSKCEKNCLRLIFHPVCFAAVLECISLVYYLLGANCVYFNITAFLVHSFFGILYVLIGERLYQWKTFQQKRSYKNE